ncbi:MAG: hypothetical protein IJU60_03120 [Acholeplasmatales bacterium]|nr:hypothetical protein [Acholeplasmatales bacterium]
MDVKKMVELQVNIFNMLKKSIDNDHLSHAYLFYGPNGTGKKEMAFALSCLLYGVDLDSPEGKQITEGKHLNVEYIAKEEGKTAVSKEQILSIQDEFSKTSLVSGKRIYIVDGLDTATKQAQNSLLKFIEEPSGEYVGIFLATELSDVLSTIQSRCEIVYFKPISNEDLINELKNNWVDPLDSALASSLTNSIDEALEIVKSDDFLKTKEIFLRLIELKSDFEGVEFFSENVEYFIEKSRLEMLINFVLLYLRDINLLSKDNNNLILAPLYDKIVSAKSNRKYNYKAKYEMVLDLMNKLDRNVTAKNVFFELVNTILK